MKNITLYNTNGSIFFKGQCEITDIEDPVVEPEPIEEPEEKIYLRDYVTSPEPISIKSNLETALPYHVYAGYPENRYLWQEYRDVLYLILKSLYYTYGDSGRECLFTGIYDGCGTKDNHPGSSHAFSKTNGRTVDLSYWTYIGDCFTQMWNIPLEYSWNQLWESDLIDTHFVKIFDWERFYTFAVRLKEVLPNASITVDTRIKEYVNQRVKFNYGADSLSLISYIQGDPVKKYDHHLHMHVVLDTYVQNINWDADIRHWWQ